MNISNDLKCSPFINYQKGASSTPLLIGVAVAAVMIAGSVFWYINQGNATQGIISSNAPPQFILFKDIIVNLLPDDTEEMHFMQVDIALMTRSNLSHKTVEGNLPVIRNAILDLLATWSFNDVQKPENRPLLRDQLLKAIHKIPDLPNIRGVESTLITNLVVQ